MPSSDEMFYNSIVTQNMHKSHTGSLYSHTRFGQMPHKINVDYLVWFLMKATQVNSIATQDLDKRQINVNHLVLLLMKATQVNIIATQDIDKSHIRSMSIIWCGSE